MKLNKLFKGNDVPETEISQIDYDSRKCVDGSLFVAVKGLITDGHKYIESAIDKGAKAVIYQDEGSAEGLKARFPGITFINTEDSRAELAKVSATFYDEPTKDIKLVGVTGTNGKTTTSYLLHNIFSSCGEKAGLLGTIHNLIGNKEVGADRTTAESVELQSMFSQMRNEGLSSAALELSSHALYLKRTQGLELNSVIFSNLTEDHLDFHGTMEKYLDAKLIAFNILKESSKKDKYAFVNADSQYFAQVKKHVEGLKLPLLSFGFSKDADYKAELKELNIFGMKYNIYKRGKFFREAELGLIGGFNVLNSISAIACAEQMGYEPDTFMPHLKEVKVPGRFEPIICDKKNFTVIVDYAHTDDALTNVLQTARSLKPRKLITVFGCGGDRDRKKRPLMGEAAGRLSDIAILTCDNPRTEDISQIMDDTKPGIDKTQTPYLVINDRQEAIDNAVRQAEEGDMVVVAGKGHETYQIFRDRTIHFDDREAVREALSKL